MRGVGGAIEVEFGEMVWCVGLVVECGMRKKNEEEKERQKQREKEGRRRLHKV